jgi:hypothetical protein
MQTCNHQQRAARMRGIACGVWFRSSSRERRVACALERGSPARGLRIGQSRGGKARGGGEEGGGLLSARDCGKVTRKKPTVVRETKGGVEARACVLPEMHKCPQAPCGREHLPGSGLDVFRVRSGLRVQRSHRRTLSTRSDECSAVAGRVRRFSEGFL